MVPKHIMVLKEEVILSWFSNVRCVTYIDNLMDLQPVQGVSWYCWMTAWLGSSPPTFLDGVLWAKKMDEWIWAAKQNLNRT